jgi:2-alkyl-3-oxoalkanoate reductase
MRIFLTGAAGLIGGEMAARLTTAGHGVVGLVRAKTDIYANDGTHVPAAGFAGNGPAAAQMLVVHGDVSRPDLGLPPDVIQALTAQTDLVLHCAAITAFDADAALYDAVNVRGTAHVRALFENARFLHVSTAYVCGKRDGAIAEVPHDAQASFANGYEASKAAAETIIHAAGGRYVIARPSIVIGAHACGTIRSFDTIYALLRLIAHGRIPVIPLRANCSLDFVPIDHVASGLMDIISNWDRAAGDTIHLSSGAPVSGPDLFGAIGRFDQLDCPAIADPDVFCDSQLSPLERRIYRRTAAHYASYFRHDPRFSVGNIARLTGRICPPVDAAALARMISYCIDTGFIRSVR